MKQPFCRQPSLPKTCVGASIPMSFSSTALDLDGRLTRQKPCHDHGDCLVWTGLSERALRLLLRKIDLTGKRLKRDFIPEVHLDRVTQKRPKNDAHAGSNQSLLTLFLRKRGKSLFCHFCYDHNPHIQESPARPAPKPTKNLKTRAFQPGA